MKEEKLLLCLSHFFKGWQAVRVKGEIIHTFGPHSSLFFPNHLTVQKPFLAQGLYVDKQPGCTWPLGYTLQPPPCSPQPCHSPVLHLQQLLTAFLRKFILPRLISEVWVALCPVHPHRHPPGLSVLCSSRPEHPLVSALCLRLGLMEAPILAANQSPHTR